MRKRRINFQKGFVLVEALVASTVCLVLCLSLIGTAIVISRLSHTSLERVEAAFLLEEGMESVRILRDNGWTANLVAHPRDVPFYLVFDGITWNATTTPQYIGIFERTIVLSNVYRDGSQNITSVPGTLDTNIVKVTSYVSWNTRGATTTRSISTYLTNIFAN